MVFLKHNTGDSLQQQKSSNLKTQQQQQDQMLNNRLPNANFKKDINMLTAKHQETTTITDSAKESQQSKQIKNGTENPSSFSKSDSENPFIVKLEINIVVVTLFAVALGLRLYSIDQPNSVV